MSVRTSHLHNLTFLVIINDDEQNLCSRMSTSLRRLTRTFSGAFNAAVSRLDRSLDPRQTILRLRAHRWCTRDGVYLFHIANATFWLVLMEVPRFPYKLAIPLLYTVALLVPLTSQFFLPATPVFSWLLTYYSNRFTPAAWRPPISVSLLPTLESVLYGANISPTAPKSTCPVCHPVRPFSEFGSKLPGLARFRR
jgi:hypothetical protein